MGFQAVLPNTEHTTSTIVDDGRDLMSLMTAHAQRSPDSNQMPSALSDGTRASGTQP
jgi:hypothetical protein